MRIEELHLKNFRCFKELDIQFPKSNLAVFIGLNGAGKSAILDAIKIMLSPDDALMKEMFLLDSDINIEENEVKVSAKFDINLFSISWEHSKLKNTSSIQSCITESTDKYNAIKGGDTDVKNIYVMGECKRFFNNVYHYKTTRKNDFEEFKDWFIEEDAKENRIIREKKDFSITSPKLDVLRQAIETFCSHIQNMKVDNMRTKDIADTEIVLNFNEKELSLSQLSDGQRNLLLLVYDIAFSLINDEADDKNPIDILKGNRIILIDEIELHLHPQWQREVLPALQKTFPNIQFIVTTHSPQVLSRVHKDDIFILKDNQLYQPSSNPIGRDSADIMNEVMGEPKRPPDIQELTDEYFSLINRKLFDEAQAIREKLLKKPYTLDKKDPLFIRADAMITRMQLLKK